MNVSSIIVMIVGMVILWGGLGASIWHAIKKGKQQ